MGTVLATIALAAVFVAPVAWGQGTRAQARAATRSPSAEVTKLPLPEAPTREPTAEETARWEHKTTLSIGDVDPTLGELVLALGLPTEVVPGHFQAYFGDDFVVTPVPQGESIVLIFVRSKLGASKRLRPNTNWINEISAERRRTDIVGERARAFQDPRPLDFRGGSLAEFFAAIFPQSIGVEVVYESDGLRSWPIDPLRMNAISADGALDILGMLYKSQFKVQVWPGSTLNPWQPPRLIVTATPTTAAQLRMSSEPTVVRLPPASAATDSVRKEQERMQDEILRAIADGIALRGGPSRNFKLKLNPSTGILFVLGTAEEQELVRGVARAMMPEGARANDVDAASSSPRAPAAVQNGDPPQAPPAVQTSAPEPTKPGRRPKTPAPTP